MKNALFWAIFGIFLAYLGSARENPFVPTSDEKNTDAKNTKKNAPDPEVFEDFDFKLPSTARILKDIKITYQDIDGSVHEQNFNINRRIDWHFPISINQKDALQTPVSDVISVKKIIFFARENFLYINTKRELLRSFILPEPFRIVLDFKKGDDDANTNMQMTQKYFSGINFIVHKNFYRAQVVLDGNYDYEVQKTDDGYKLRLK